MANSIYLTYARALVSSVNEQTIDDKIDEEIRTIHQLLSSNQLLSDTLENPALAFQPKREIVEQLALRLNLSHPVRNFILVLLRNGRIGQFDHVLEALEEVLDEKRGIIRGNVISAHSLTNQTRSQLKKAVENMTGRGAKLEFQLNKDLIGGIQLRIGSTIYDGSIKTALEKLKKKLATL